MSYNFHITTLPLVFYYCKNCALIFIEFIFLECIYLYTHMPIYVFTYIHVHMHERHISVILG